MCEQYRLLERGRDRIAIVKEFKRNSIVVIPYQTVTLAESEQNGTEL